MLGGLNKSGIGAKSAWKKVAEKTRDKIGKVYNRRERGITGRGLREQRKD